MQSGDQAERLVYVPIILVRDQLGSDGGGRRRNHNRPGAQRGQDLARVVGMSKALKVYRGVFGPPRKLSLPLMASRVVGQVTRRVIPR